MQCADPNFCQLQKAVTILRGTKSSNRKEVKMANVANNAGKKSLDSVLLEKESNSHKTQFYSD